MPRKKKLKRKNKSITKAKEEPAEINNKVEDLKESEDNNIEKQTENENNNTQKSMTDNVKETLNEENIINQIELNKPILEDKKNLIEDIGMGEEKKENNLEEDNILKKINKTNSNEDIDINKNKKEVIIKENNIIDSELKEDNNIKEKIISEKGINLDLIEDNIKENEIKDDNIKENDIKEENFNLNEVKDDDLKDINIEKEINLKEENNSPQNEINIIEDEIKEEEENKDEIKEKDNQNNEDKKNVLKIANIEYERFIKENAKLYQYINKVKIPIIIQTLSGHKKDEIKLKNSSFLKIIKQAALENDFKIYLTIQIITETVQFEKSSNKNISFNPTVQNFIKNINKLNISFNHNNINDILIQKESLVKIFSQMGKDYYKDMFNFMEFIITEISYEYSHMKKVYVLKGVKNLRKLMEQNNIFFINKNDLQNELYNDVNNLIPISNYSVQKIFNFIDGGKDTKYLLFNYKFKTDEFIKYENANKNMLDKLINISDIKNTLSKYQQENENESVTILQQEKLKSFNDIDIYDLDNYLTITEQKFLNIIDQISSKKQEIIKLAEEENNQFIEVIDSLNNVKFFNMQYLKLMKGENDKLNKNLYSFDFYDFNNDKITIMKKHLENISKEDKIYVEIKIKDKNYLVNKNKLLKIYDSWKILLQEDIIDAIDIKNIKDKLKEFNNEKINILLIDADIIEQYIIKEIKINENHEDIHNENENDNNENNLIIIEEEDINTNEEEKKLKNKRATDNKGNKGDKEKKEKKMSEYIKSLPPKQTYNIKYKVKIERIPKKRK